MQDHAYQAVRTAILMQQKQIELRESGCPKLKMGEMSWFGYSDADPYWL